MTDQSKVKTTSTDMFVNIIANTEKLVGTDNRWMYEDGYKHDTLDENVDAYVNPKNNQQQQQQQHKNHDIFQKPNDVCNNYHKNIDTQQCEQPCAQQCAHENDKNESGDEMLQKLDILRQLAEFRSYGVPISQNYGLDSDLKIMQCELKLHSDIKTKRNAVQWMSHMLIGFVKGIELLNDNYNPFDIKLNGLSTKINADIHDYYIVLGEIYEKYHQPGKQMAPELKLLLMLSGTILSIQAPRVLSSLLKSGMSKELNENDKVMSELRQKANTASNPSVSPSPTDEKIKDAVTQEHKKASQKASDLQLLKEKEIETQKLRQMAEKLNSNNKNFKDALLLSADSSCAKQNESLLQNPTMELTKNERDFFRAMKYNDETKHLELARELAHQKSTQNEKLKHIATEQQKMNNILKKLEPDNNSCVSNDSQKSSISVNPNLDKIMKATPKKTKKMRKNIDVADNIANKIINNDNISQSSTGSIKSQNILNYFPSEMISVGSANKGNIPLINI